MLSWVRLNKLSRPCFLICKMGSAVSRHGIPSLSYSVPTQVHGPSLLLFLDNPHAAEMTPPPIEEETMVGMQRGDLQQGWGGDRSTPELRILR